MASPLSDRIEQSENSVYDLVLSQFQGDISERLNVEQMFVLIDGVLPFEACLYHQVLPLYLEGSRLNLGMVSPEDSAASEYVRRIISYLNYSVVSRAISSDALQVVLSAYLNYASKKEARRHPSADAARSKSPKRSPAKPDLHDRQTIIVDSPQEIERQGMDEQAELEGTIDVPPAPPVDMNGVDISASEGAIAMPGNSSPRADATDPTQPDLPRSPLPSPVAPPPQTNPEAEPPAAKVPADPKPATRQSVLVGTVPRLLIQAKYLASPVEVLVKLPPQELLQELLVRVLTSGIGRLYFERQKQQGRVLWSQDGVLQSVLEQLSPQKFQGLVNELKTLAHLSLTPVQSPQQVEIERMYHDTRVLLRFRFMPGGHGEEATLQVLRGTALKFYQQQQIDKLGRDAMTIAKQLQFKLNEIRQRSIDEPDLMRSRIDALAGLSEMLGAIEAQINAIQGDHTSNHSPPSHHARNGKSAH